MLFLLLVWSLTQSDPGDASPIPMIQPRADVSCNDLNNCRTIWDILWSCLSTIFLCTWVTLHPNIAIARDTRVMGWFRQRDSGHPVLHPLLRFMKNKVPLFLCALVAPEYILGWAVRQYLMAGEIQRKVPGWTRTHGFFVIMGGFHLYRLPNGALSDQYPSEFNSPTEFTIIEPLTTQSREEEIAEHPLGFADLSVRALTFLAPCETEIKDKGKAGVLAKLLALAQTLCLFIYYFWWDKPKDVECPVRVYKTLKAGLVEASEKQGWESGVLGIWERTIRHITGVQDGFFLLREEAQVPMFWSGNPSKEIAMRTMLGPSVIGVAFGAIHFVAWYSEFPSRTEFLLWRISCIAITAVPLTVTVTSGIAEMKLTHKTWAQIISVSIGISSLLTVPLYVFARIATFVMAFTTFRALPLDAFKTVD